MDVSELTRTLGKRVRARRRELGFSQEELAERAGLHPTYIGQLERGEKNATLETLFQLCQGLGISLSALLEGLGPQGDGDPFFTQCGKLLEDIPPGRRSHVAAVLRELAALCTESCP